MGKVSKVFMKLSIVIPCYCSENSINIVVEELNLVLGNELEYEIILVNDCSPDLTWETIMKLAIYNNNIKAINLAKNSGQHAAILAGLRYVTGDYIAVVDDDGQTPVECIPQMISKLSEGWDVVSAKYVDRGRHSLFRDLGSFFAVKMSKWLLNGPKDVMVSVFFVAKKFVIEEIIKYDQPYPYIMGLILRTTAKITNVTVDQRQRLQGKSGYTFRKLFGLWLNGFTAFSIKPLQLTSYVGIIAALAGFFIAIVTIAKKLMGVDVVIGWSSMMAVELILGGCILLVLGLLGEYVGRIYLSVNKTPQSIVRDVVSSKKVEES